MAGRAGHRLPPVRPLVRQPARLAGAGRRDRHGADRIGGAAGLQRVGGMTGRFLRAMTGSSGRRGGAAGRPGFFAAHGFFLPKNYMAQPPANHRSPHEPHRHTLGMPSLNALLGPLGAAPERRPRKLFLSPPAAADEAQARRPARRWDELKPPRRPEEFTPP